MADYVDILFFLVLLLKLKRPAVGNGAKIVLQLVLGHSTAVIGYGKGAGILVNIQTDKKSVPPNPGQTLGKRAIIQLVYGIAGVGYQLAQENLLMGVNGVNHQVE